MGTIMNLRKKVILPTTKQDCVIAVSGGVDSMCLLHYMKDHNNVTAVHIHHNSNSDDDTSLKIVENYCTKHNIKLDVFKISEKIESNFECQAREFRHSIFKQYKEPVYLGHTLDDQVEEYLMSNIKGRLRIINAVNGNTVATGNYKKRPKFDPWPTPHDIVKKKAKKKTGLAEIERRFGFVRK